ncbi:MAG: hypothetical protein A2X86_06995 [Bdellovibrionales bacterium GWA2_49_15]|nr:MAG: hypothetical protein A2X86_06995 [Bdellovibrionales bacterium GWA2_49_15]HAZ11978.1 hypothetical protein [Bdellovibrionales bacterium]
MKFSLLLILVLLSFQTASSSTSELENILAKINEAESKKLPQTALDLAHELEKKAKAEKNKALYIRAITKRILNQSHILGKAPKESVKILRQEVGKVSEEVRPLVKIILARWFWHYYEQNRYKFSARTQTVGLETDDFTTWDSYKIFAEVRALFEDGLKNADYLKKEKVEDYNGLIERGNLFQNSSVTLYEFSLREMITFLTYGTSALPAPEDKFEVDAASGAFAPHQIFLDYKPQTTDKESPLLRGIEIYQQLMQYYHEKKMLEQFVDADVARLKFIHAQVADLGKTESFLVRLKEIEDEFKDVSTSTMASFEMAKQHHSDQEYSTAVRVCEKAVQRHPQSDGASLCQDLLKSIKHPLFSLKTENSINKSNSNLLIKYKNIKKLYFRVVEDDWKNYLNKKWRRLDDALERDDAAKILLQKPILQWTRELAETKDFKDREVEEPIADLPYGFYKIFASSDPQFSSSNIGNQETLAYTSFWKTDTLILVRGQEKTVSGLLLDARNGKPLDGKTIAIYQRNNNKEGIHEKVGDVRSNKNGLWEYLRDQKNGDWSMVFHVNSKDTGDTVYAQWINVNYVPQKISDTRVMFFTDRAIYRPGQRIHFKGVCYKLNQKSDEYSVAECSDVLITLHDANRKEIAKVVKSSNAFGSFSGDFIAPKNVLMGAMSILSSTYPGQTTIRIEEYKRPKFEVTMDSPEKQYRLDDVISVSGKALSYAGAPLGSVKVKFRVLRGVRLPWWWYWGNPYASEQEILHGQVKTDDDGQFAIEFKAKPNKAVNPKFKPFFSYRTEVDVVDSTGETRSGNVTTNVGYVSMQARPTVASWLPNNREVDIAIATTTLDGKPTSASGTIDIHSLNGPKDVQRRPSTGQYYNWYWYWATETKESDSKKDLSNIENWEIGKSIKTTSFTAKEGKGNVSFKLDEGAYCAVLKSQDKFGSEIEEKIFFTVFEAKDNNFQIKVPSFFRIQNTSLKVGEKLEAVLATGYQNGGAYINFTQHGKVLKSYWSKPGEQLHAISFPITENLKGGFTLETVYVQENQLYYNNNLVNVERPEKQLKVTVETMRSKLRPGERDTWSLKIEGQNASKLASELAATMYDASLDAFAPLSFSSFTGYWMDSHLQGYNSTLVLKDFFLLYTSHYYSAPRARQYPHFTYDILNQFSYLFPYMYFGSRSKGDMMSFEGDAPMSANMMEMDGVVSKSKMAKEEARAPQPEGKANSPGEAPATAPEKKPEVMIRSNLNETAFFYPHLIADGEGKVKLEFTMPEALTRWKFMAMAHGKQTEFGTVMKEIVTQKELMVTPNPPRFLRQGDQLYFTVKVDNLSDQEQKGETILELSSANNDKEVTKDFVQGEKSFKFTIPAKKSMAFAWPLKVPDVTYSLIYKVKAVGQKFSDGEEGLLPILSRRIFIRESMPLWISGKGHKTFNFDKLLQSEKSTTLKSEKLVLQMTSNPAWYAVQAIPYLYQSFPECTDYVFERLFANSLGEKIVDSNPKIEKIFKQWRGTEALKSNLQKAQDLKGVSLEETPWVAEAESEEKAKNDVGKFFEKNNLHQDLGEAYGELESRLLGGGGWPWFSGGPIDYYTTLYLVTGFGKLRHLGVDVKMDLAHKSLANLDSWIKDIYDHITHKELNNFSHLIAYYLYGRSFFLKERPIASENKEAVDYFLGQARKFWTELDSRLSEANTALATMRFGERDITDAIIKSLRERALHSEELGMYWADEEWAYWWYRAPIEAQARIIELFHEVVKSEKEIDQLNVWVLKQKQTQSWKTSRATSEVVYTLLLAGSDLLKSDKLVAVSLGGSKVEPKNVEAGTGFYEKRFTPSEIKAGMGKVQIEKKDKGIAWGGLHWHYFEDISKVTPHKTPLFLTKKLFVKRNTKKGPTLFPLTKEKIEVGETLVVRVELRSDRDMEYVHMKDMRGSGTEPVNVLSHWKYQDGLAYYESTRDTATHFFFAYLPKGTYVFEYDLKVFHKGEYQTGMAEIECMYAPEFSSHSETILLKAQ